MKTKIILVLFGLSLATLFAEMFFRLSGLAPDLIPITKGRYRLADDPKLAYEPIPGVYYTGENLYAYDYRANETNSYGFRSKEYGLRRAPNTYRVAILGDSLGVGLWIDKYEQTFAGILEAELAKALEPKGLHVEVLNFGVVGYNTMQEVAMFKSKVKDFNPDLVVLEYCHNDTERSDGALFQSLVNEADAKKRPLAVNYSGLFLNSALYRFVKFVAFAPKKESASSTSGGDWVKKLSQDSVEESLAELGALSRSTNIPVLLAVFPRFGDLLNYNYKDRHQTLQNLAKINGLEFLDLLPSFVSCQNASPNSLSIDEYHPSQAGHECAGRSMSSYILKRSRL